MCVCVCVPIHYRNFWKHTFTVAPHEISPTSEYVKGCKYVIMIPVKHYLVGWQSNQSHFGCRSHLNPSRSILGPCSWVVSCAAIAQVNRHIARTYTRCSQNPRRHPLLSPGNNRTTHYIHFSLFTTLELGWKNFTPQNHLIFYSTLLRSVTKISSVWLQKS